MKAEDSMIQATGPMVLTPGRASCAGEAARRTGGDEALRRGGDSVELSHVAQSQIADEEPFRSELVQRIRAEIADDKYLTDDKLDAVVERLHRELFS
jgi:anti-sigma28 factor (negative regulator of flagellin synthesis)